VTDWLRNSFCSKCQGDGWVWAHELDEYHGEGSPMTDDTKYQCDHVCHQPEDLYEEEDYEPRMWPLSPAKQE